MNLEFRVDAEMTEERNGESFFLRHPCWTLFFISFGVVLFFLSPVIFTSEYFWGSGTDIQNYQFPHRDFAFGWLRRGVWPLWNPFVFNGVPFQTGIHPMGYPGTMLGLVFPTGWEIKLTIWLHLGLAFFFMGLLLREECHSLRSCIFGGMGYALGGFMVSHTYGGHLDIITSAAYLPLVFLAFDRALRGPGIGRILLAGAAFGLMVLTGHYQIIHISVLGIAVFTGARIVCGDCLRRPDTRSEIQTRAGDGPPPGLLLRLRGWLVKLVAVCAVGCVLASFQLLPLMENSGYFNRPAAGDYAFATSLGSPKLGMLTCLFPGIFGGVADVPFFADWIEWEGQYFLGVVAAVFILFFFCQSGVRRWLPFAIVILLGTCLSSGRYAPFYKMYFLIDPFVQRFRVPSRFMLLVSFFGAWAAAGGFEIWLAEGVRRRRLASLIAIGGAVLAAFVFWLMAFDCPEDAGWWSIFLKNVLSGETAQKLISCGLESPSALLVFVRGQIFRALIVFAGAGLAVLAGAKYPRARPVLATGLLLLSAGELLAFARPKMTTEKPSAFAIPSEIVSFLKENAGNRRVLTSPRLMFSNGCAMYGIGNFGGYDPLMDERYSRAVNLAMGRDPGQRQMLMDAYGYGPFWELQGVRYLLASRPVGEHPPEYRKAFSGFAEIATLSGVHVYGNPAALPRAFVVRRIERVADAPDAIRRLAEESLRGKILWTDDLGEPPAELRPFISRGSAPAPEEVRIEEMTPHRVTMESDLGDPGILVLTDAPYPGWRATVNGAEAKMHWVDGGLHRAVALPAGKNAVKFTYWPRSLSLGICVSLASALVCMLFFVRALCGKRLSA